MSFPIYFRLFGVALHPHLVFEALAYTAAFQTFLLMRRRLGDQVSTHERWWVVAAGTLGAAAGSKLLYWLEDPAQTIARGNELAYLLGGKTIVGGLLGAWLAVEVVKRYLGVTSRTGDLFAVPLCVGIAIGRIGCLLTGLGDHTHGTATGLPWGMDFGDGIRRHPTAAYESIFALGLGVALWSWQLRSHTNGDIFKGFMLAYLGWRLLVDFLKPGIELMGLTVIQWACIGGIALCAPRVADWLGMSRKAANAAWKGVADD